MPCTYAYNKILHPYISVKDLFSSCFIYFRTSTDFRSSDSMMWSIHTPHKNGLPKPWPTELLNLSWLWKPSGLKRCLPIVCWNWAPHIHRAGDKRCGDDLPVRMHNASAFVLLKHLTLDDGQELFLSRLVMLDLLDLDWAQSGQTLLYNAHISNRGAVTYPTSGFARSSRPRITIARRVRPMHLWRFPPQPLPVQLKTNSYDLLWHASFKHWICMNADAHQE